MPRPRASTLLLCVLACAASGVAIARGAGAATTAQRLVIVTPRTGSVTAPDVRLVARLAGPAGSSATFTVRVDGTPGSLQDPAGGTGAVASATVRAGADLAVILRNLPEGVHRVQLLAAGGSAAASDVVEIDVRSGGLNLPGLLLVAVLVGALLLYRRRILKPFMDRYEHPPPRPAFDDEEDD